jgi:serine/threonine-protein kinase
MGKRRLENYRILGELGRGGMSTVYKAVQISLERTVAIKEIHPNFSTSPELIARFEREARAVGLLSHPCIVQIHDYIHQDDTHFMVMEFIEGVNLKSAIERRERLAPEEAASVGVRVSAALAYAHAAGIIHRDIKPSNILLTRDGQVKVVDFGIARLEEGEELTRTGAFVGTPAYMSPEQILGERLDGRTDIFSLGVVLYEALAGDKPFSEDAGASVQSRILKSAPASLRRRSRQMPRQIERIVMRCLEKQRDRRFGSMSELNLALRAALPRRERQRPRVLIALANALQETPSAARGKRSAAADGSTATSRPLSGRRALGFAAGLCLTVGLGFFLWSNTLSPLRSASGRKGGADGPARTGRPSPVAPGSTLPERARPGAVAAGPTGRFPDPDSPRATALPRPSDPPAPQSSAIAPPPANAAPVSATAGVASAPPLLTVPGPAGAAAAARAPGFLKVVVRPWAEVRVDGKLYDTTPFEAPISLAPGEHTIVLVHESLPTRRLTVTVESGETKRLDVDLRR